MSIHEQLYQDYFKLNLHQRINERQHRNGLNITHLFSTVVSQCTHSKYTKETPKINNGLYHHIGKTHSQYPKHFNQSVRHQYIDSIHREDGPRHSHANNFG